MNRPQLASGMTRIMYEEPETGKNGEVIRDGESGWQKENWYNYQSQQWANVMTQDGSMWVWIPRYAYIINDDKTMDIKFLVGTTNKWYNETTGEEEELPAGYIVHPCFQNGSGTGYANGEWKTEIRGIWVAKFEAGLPSSSSAEKTTSVSGLANSYYPVFQGQKQSYNYINVSQCYLLAKALATDSGNPYGFTNSTDSHLMKNSEWGAVAYLSYSKYGKTRGSYDTTKEVYINNVNCGESVTSIRNYGVYAITGYAGETKSASVNTLTSTILGDTVEGDAGTSYAWYTQEGTQASTTGNIYGIYDMSGGLTEYTSAYIKMASNATLLGYLKSYGSAFVFKDNSQTEFTGNTEYVTEYPEYTSNGLKNALTSIGRYGDAFLETWGWFGDWTNNDVSGPFIVRGNYWNNTSASGLFAFDDLGGESYYVKGWFRFSYYVGRALALCQRGRG